MASIKARQEYPNRSAQECYQACLQALKAAGYQIVKQRDYGWFVIASHVVDSDEITCNLFAGLGVSAFIDLNMSARKLSESQLQAQIDVLLNLINKALE